MAFPAFATPASGATNSSNTTTHTCALPTNSSGDLLVVIISQQYNLGNGPGSFTPPAGWTEIADDSNGSSVGSCTIAKISTGGETQVVVTSSLTGRGAYFAFAVTGAYSTVADGIAAGTASFATGSTTPDPPSVTAPWGSADNLFLCYYGVPDTSTTVTSYPTNYTYFTGRALGSFGVQICAAARQLAAASDNPPQFVKDGTTTGQRVAQTLVIRPAATGGDTQAPTTPGSPGSSAIHATTIDWTWTASTDNVGVTGYEIRLNGGSAVNVGNVLTVQSTGLTQNTQYAFEVRAYDAANNKSAWTTPINRTTLNKRITYTLKNAGGTPRANLTGLKIAVWDALPGSSMGAPVLQTASGITDGSGTGTLNINNSSQAVGQAVVFGVTNSDGNPANAHDGTFTVLTVGEG